MSQASLHSVFFICLFCKKRTIVQELLLQTFASVSSVNCVYMLAFESDCLTCAAYMTATVFIN